MVHYGSNYGAFFVKKPQGEKAIARYFCSCWVGGKLNLARTFKT